MTAARRLMSDYSPTGRAQRGAPPASAGADEIASGVLRLAAPVPENRPDGRAGLGEVLVQPGRASVRGSALGGHDCSALERRADVDADVFTDEPARLAWLGRLICLLTATSVSATLVWAVVG